MAEIYDGYDYNDQPLGIAIGEASPDAFPSGGLNDWGSWARNIAGSVITGAVDVYKYKTIGGAGGVPAVDQYGRVYTEGYKTQQPSGIPANVGGISTTLIVVGAVAVAALLLLRK